MSKFLSFKDLIIYEDENFVFINKPSNISSLDERDLTLPSIKKMAKDFNSGLQLCHRLDKETSGILVLSKNEDAYKKMAQKFETREVKKNYHAIVQGNFDVKQKSISLPLTITKIGVAKIDRREGKFAETIFTTIKKFRNFSLIECQPITGRLHQIRIHLASQNFPIAADEVYGGKIPKLAQLKKKFKPNEDSEQNGMINRVALHAFSIEFTLFENKYFVEAPYPKDFKVFVKLIEKYDN